ncbi:DUF1376 domain-containing protein [Castellaniella denitrificans]|uniref:DUF1376 domain-containing protein n=1 Tax=Castellaniella denitrificans TaxID=56119 RepID=A0ABT4M608_9BURK|nr:DUF1376 domain-containing protein [Castellaniella denitrificans]MCZ4330758.1 DUF1376 domain-containing protein [Castellaniella denitrificans]
MNDLPTPLTPADCDLRDFAFLPLDVVRLRDSDLAIHVTGEEFRCAVLLWCASWHQVPAASLPDDDKTLAALAGFGRAVGEWAKHRDGALHGWIKCSDGRLYHPVVAEKAMDALKAKLEQRWKTECARVKKHNQRHGTDLQIHDFDTWVSLGCPQGQVLYVPGTGNASPDDKSVNDAGHSGDVPGNPPDSPDSVPGETHSKGQGEGQGQRNIKDNPHPPSGPGWQKPDWVPADLWREFEALRKKRKKPLTDRARDMAVAKLQALQDGGHDVKAVMEQSILHAWDTFYPLKSDAAPAAAEAWSDAV